MSETVSKILDREDVLAVLFHPRRATSLPPDTAQSRTIRIPVADARALHAHSGSDVKQLMVVPGAGHNTLLAVDPEGYFGAIRDFTR